MVVEQMEVLGCLSFFVKTMISGIFGFLEKLNWTVTHKVWLEYLQPIYVRFCLFDFVRISTSSMRPLLHISCNKFGKFSIGRTFSSPVLRTCVLIQSIYGFFLLTDFMYVMVLIHGFTISFLFGKLNDFY